MFERYHTVNYLSLGFGLFVACFMVLFYLVPTKFRRYVLLLGSLIFYASYDLRYFLFLLFVAASTFLAAKMMDKKRRKAIFVVVIALNAAVWYAVKVLPWTVWMLKRGLALIGISIVEPEWNLLIPLGISYYILQAISYLADVYKGKIEPEKSFGKYLLFLSWFPAVVQGPISRYDKLMPQLLHDKKYSFDAMRDNLVLILFGLVKKMVIADRLAIYVNTCFDQFADLRGIVLYLAAVVYAFQLYTDFSGCVDICRGVSGLFGVELIPNFNRPYFSRSVKEFWGRWHMSLSGWLKDYIYIPLGGNRKGTLRKYINLMITFLVSGLWHGAGTTFFVWGALHAIYQIVGQCTAGIRSRVRKLIRIEENSASEKIYQTLITFHLVTLAWIFFRSTGFMDALQYIRNMLSEAQLWKLLDGSLYSLGLNQNYWGLLIAHICGLFAIEHFSKDQTSAVATLTRQHVIIRWVVYLILIFDVILFGVYGSGYDMRSFMYGGF